MTRFEWRFWAKVDVQGSEECWLWTACVSGGYGSFSVKGEHRQAHRVAYELLVGPIPADRELDHLCGQKLCVNPGHLDPVTHQVNMMRSTGLAIVPECSPAPEYPLRHDTRDIFGEVTTRLAILLDNVKDPDWVTAGLCGFHASTLSRYKNGSRAMPTKHAQKLAEHLGVTLDDVRGNADEEWRASLGEVAPAAG